MSSMRFAAAIASAAFFAAMAVHAGSAAAQDAPAAKVVAQRGHSLPVNVVMFSPDGRFIRCS